MAGVAEVSGHLSSAQDQCLGQRFHLHRLCPHDVQTLGVGPPDPITLPDAHYMVSALNAPFLPLPADTEHTLCPILRSTSSWMPSPALYPCSEAL